jgi:hypothetical protein
VRETTPDRTRLVLGLVFAERQAQESRYGRENLTTQSGTGPETCWLGPYTGDSADEIQVALRWDYDEYADEAPVTWVHLVREEIAEAFQESDPTRLAEELIQVAALCVSWVERLDYPLLSVLPSEE